MQFTPLSIPDVILISQPRYQDDRGYFMELFRESDFRNTCGDYRLVQDNLSHSQQGTLRGLHYQELQPQGKLLQVISGRIFDVAVDLRLTSPTYGQWVGQILSGGDGHQLWIPPGFAHGFYVLSEVADILYKCSDYYSPADERILRWDSPQLAIDWPLLPGVPLRLSDKDAKAPVFSLG